MKGLAEGWAEPIQECAMAIPEGTEAQAIKTEDFVPHAGMWDCLQARVTMVGDAAHAMAISMFYSTPSIFTAESRRTRLMTYSPR